jgi:hypothetical protein
VTSSELIQYRNRLLQCRLSQLSAACRYYDLKKSGTKQEVVERLLEFLYTASRDERNQLPRALDSGVGSPRMDSVPGTRRNSNGAHSTPITPVVDDLTDGQKLLYSLIDPFHPLANIENPFLFYGTCRNGSTTFTLDLPELKSMRRQGYSIWLRGMPKRIVKNERQKWPNEIRVYINMTLVGKVEAPKRLKKRRDEPIELTVFLQSGKNHVHISVGDPDNAPKYSVAIVVCGSLSDRSLISSVHPQSIDSSRERLIGIMSVKSELISDDIEVWRSLDLK